MAYRVKKRKGEGMKKRNFSKSLYGAMVSMTVFPMTILGIILSVFCLHIFTRAVHEEVTDGLRDVCSAVLTAYDEMYPGEYNLEGEERKVLVKGQQIISGDYGMLDRIKEKTEMDISLFFYDTRVLTTLTDAAGERIVGTGCSAVVMRDVYEKGQPAFYSRAKINDKFYFVYYEPLYDKDGICMGMIAAGKPAESVRAAVNRSVAPVIFILVATVVLAGVLSVYYTGKIIRIIQIIQDFLTQISQGNLTAELPGSILKREDELGRMGKSVIKMQRALRQLIERDTLTELYNRRYGNAKLLEIQEKSKISGIPFSIVIGDIDFFKQTNDTYGHEGGDKVLKEIAVLLRKYIVGKGFVARWGGEEFLIVFRQLNGREAADSAREMLEKIRALEIPCGEEIIRITMTFGVKEGNSEEKIGSLIRQADDRLYYGKKNGRNRVIFEEASDESRAAEAKKGAEVAGNGQESVKNCENAEEGKHTFGDAFGGQALLESILNGGGTEEQER